MFLMYVTEILIKNVQNIILGTNLMNNPKGNKLK